MGSQLFRGPPRSTPRGRRRSSARAVAGWQRLALATSALLGASTIGTGSLPARAAEGPLCHPAARLDGDQALVVPIGRLLRARGIAARPQPGECRPVEVEIKPVAAGLHLTILDPEGRTSRRQLPSVESAALVIESWSRGDHATSLPDQGANPLDETPASTLLMGLPTSSPSNEPSSQQEVAGTDDGEPVVHEVEVREVRTRAFNNDSEIQAASAPVSAPSTPRPWTNPLAISVSGESALALNRSSWWGGSAGVCLRTGPLCTGLVGRYGRAIALAPAASGEVPQTHHDVDLSLTAQLPLALGPVQIVPSLGLGGGRSMATFRGALLETNSPVTGNRGRDGDRRNRDDDPTHRSGPRNGSGASSSTSNAMANPSASFEDAVSARREDRLLGHAGLTLSLPVGGALAVDLGFSLGMALSSRGNLGMPRERLRGGLGLRYGGP
jgi:hypothetical protein